MEENKTRRNADHCNSCPRLLEQGFDRQGLSQVVMLNEVRFGDLLGHNSIDGLIFKEPSDAIGVCVGLRGNDDCVSVCAELESGVCIFEKDIVVNYLR